ncbi:hypothetical protein MLD38_033110 [Melastoma candidum]|uniref:Uncharacterized protein n=1 Tax=Melastoma candidum TaxID=119954 RepID=A0ACB9M644_9MYRT|nr:hypothetical protein MLD38_033110 [Melastoma candidum]
MRLLLHGSAAPAATALAKPKTPSPPPSTRTHGRSLAESSVARGPRATLTTPQTPVPAVRVPASAVRGFLAEAAKQGLHDGEVANGEGVLWRFVEVLKGVDELGDLPLEEIADGLCVGLLKEECGRLLASGDVKELVSVVEAIAGHGFPVAELAKPADVIKVLVNKRNPSLAIRYADILPQAQILFCDILRAFGKRKDFVSAIKAYEAVKCSSKGPNMFVYRTIIDVCGLCGNFQESRNIFEDLLKKGVIPNVYVLNSLMNVNAHDLDFIKQIYKKMPSFGICPDIATYNVLLKACCLAERADVAQEIYTEVKELQSAGKLKLDVFTYCTIVKVLSDAKSWNLALKVKDDMLSAAISPNMVTWSSLINACAKAGLVDHAVQLFEEMLLSGCEPNSQCCNTLLHACVEACQYDRAFRLFEAWTDSKVENNEDRDSLSMASVKKMSSVHINKNQTTSAHLTFAKRFPFSPTTATFNILMKACGSDYYRAKALMREMKTFGLAPNNISWSILINLCGSTRNLDGALQILKMMPGMEVKPDVIAYTTAIKVCVDTKNLDLAFTLFEEMKRYQVEPNLVTYNTLLQARSRYGSLNEVQQCLAVYQEMRKAGYQPNDYYLKELIEEWCEGVIQDSGIDQGEVTSSIAADSSRSNSVLLEKVAVHLQRSISESLVVNLQGLSKVEARIVVLAVLRMIKENYFAGNSVKDDILIVLGFSEGGTNSLIRGCDLRDAVIKLLRDDLGLEVLFTGPRFERTVLPVESGTSPRRPAALQRLKLTKESLYKWLGRKELMSSSEHTSNQL